MFSKILIANRGEIAVRVMRTCRRLGVRTVAVFSEADRDALHVAMADEAVAIGGAAPGESYLRGDRIVAAARETGAEAIHPGYGFLSENPDFVVAVEAAGLTFIGPPAEAIRAMGLKDAAKRLMAEAGVPVVPGYHGADQEPGHLEVEAAEIGYPVLIKAVAGGGGKGMRRVERAADFMMALEGARAEARGAFGNDAVLLEKYVETPRHIEVQVFGDGRRAVHLFERDCSLQRRHQKVIEEAPAPGMSRAMREAMGRAAVRAAEAIGYRGAGTVEFIADASRGLREDAFWFMEMNTRLQVEHPVTEAITGVDLVEWQLRAAAGEALWVAQEDLSIDGHAIEARLYAEDVAAGFLPAAGRLAHLAFPEGARVDSGVGPRDEISPFYDPMIAKIIAHGPTRGAALTALRAALDGTRVAGCTTNHAFLRRLAVHEGFAAGEVDTGLIGRDLDRLAPDPVPCSRAQSLAAMGAAGLVAAAGWERGFHLWAPLRRRVSLTRAREDIVASIEVLGPDMARVAVAGAIHEVRGANGGWEIDGARVPAEVVAHDAGVSVFWGNGYHFSVADPLGAGAAEAGRGDVVEAPMPGLVRAVFARAGEAVTAGARLAILEAMKMEHTLTAPRDGVVAEVLVREGAQVDAGAALIRLADEEEDT